ARHGRLNFFRHALQHVSGDVAGRHRVYADPILAELARPDPGHTDDSRLAGHVIRLPEIAVQADHAGSVEYDSAASGNHVRHNGSRAVEYALEIDRDHRVELLVAHDAGDLVVLNLDQLAVAQDTGIVHQHVNAAPPADNLPDGGLDRGRVGDIHAL